MTPRVLIVEPQRELRVWLRHHVEVLWPGALATEMETAQFETQSDSIGTPKFDLLLLGLRFTSGDDEQCESLTRLRLLCRRGDFPPTVLIAEAGNELTAVGALRAGVAGYLPKDALNAQRLGEALRAALKLEAPAAPVPAPKPAATAAGARKPKKRRIPSADIDLPQYSLLRKLGESTRAVVYLAHSATLGRNVALKISKPELDADVEQQYFAREYAAISALRHPAVVDIYDYGFHAGHEFIAMEYFPCGDLRTRLQQPLTVTESLEYALRIGQGLQVVHAAGLLHRDLKPPNVMLRPNGAVVLIDFGLVKNLAAYTRSTAAGVLRGSPYYMSPEQAQGQELDQRTDLYSLGVILYEMLIGRKPYSGTTAVELMHQHVHGPRPALPPELAAFEALVEGLMACERGDRFRDAAAAVDAIAAVLNASSEDRAGVQVECVDAV